MPPKKKGKKEDAEEQKKKEEEEASKVAAAAAAAEEAALQEAEAAARKKMEDLEMSLTHMNNTTAVFDKHNVVVQKMINMTREDLLWTQYMKCDGMPDPVCVRQMNTYLSLWQEDKREVMDDVIKKTEEVLPLMNTMERLLESPEEWEVPIPEHLKTRSHRAKLAERQKIFDEMKALQLTKLNRATYAILLDVSPIVDPENNVLQHYMESDIVQLGLWGNVVEKNMRVKGTEFENLGFSFELPKSLMGIRGAVRVMRVEYDHYSKRCPSYGIPPVHPDDVPSLLEKVQTRVAVAKEKAEKEAEERRLEKERIEAEQRAAKEAEMERLRLLAQDKKGKGKGQGAPAGGKGSVAAASPAPKIVKSPRDGRPGSGKSTKSSKSEKERTESPRAGSSQAIREEDKDPATKAKEKLQQRIDMYKVKCDEFELNLRRNRIMGGVIYFDMLYIPPQPKKVANWVICELEHPQELKNRPWIADYKPPAPPDENSNVKKTPEEIEREIKAQEAELQKLLQVHLKLPSTALWFEPPTIVRWDEEKAYWTSAGFYGISFNEGKQTLSFKTMHFGIFGLSAFRFSNLPFQSWELRPDGPNRAVIALSAAAVQAEFALEPGLVTLVKFSSGNKPPVRGIIDVPMKLKDLIKEMRHQGVDIFPDCDSHCYIEGLPLKDIPTERHLYYCMALTANSISYSWSRWNLLSGYEKLIMQFKEKVPGGQETSQKVMLVTPDRTSVLECTEASQTFSDAPEAGLSHFADLYNLSLNYCSSQVTKQMEQATPIFVDSVYQFLLATLVLSYA